jgi:glycine/D-amino acid oxidase-like deaminating enzyme
LDTDSGSVKAPVILRATEGYTDSIAGQQRALLPVYSMMVATEPLSDAMWQDIGLRERETFGDRRRVVIYGQRTRDNRIAFGGRSGYYFGSKRFAVMPQDHPDDIRVESTLKALLPILQEVQITHRWGGPLGVPRHWRPCVTFNSKTGFGTAGGYTGEGVAASNLAGRILADLVSGEQTDITKLAWVDDNARHWEREPLRWMGAKTAEWLASAADRREAESGKPSRVLGGLFSAITGH